MAIEVRIPKEITEYKERIIFGLNIRQLISFVAAIIVGLTTYYFANKYLGADAASYIVIIIVIPIFALGFFKKDGFTFEQYVKIIFRHFWGKSKRNYEVDLNITKIEGNEKIIDVRTKKKAKKQVRKGKARREEKSTILFERTKKKRKAKSKAVKRSIKNARKEHKIAKRQALKGA